MTTRRDRRPARYVVWALVGGVMAGVACDLNDPDELQNNANYAIVRAQFFASRDSRVPVPGVRMVVEAPEESERPYNGPDVVAISGEDGIAEARVFPGYQEQQDQGGGGEGGVPTGPANPLDAFPPLYFADVAVTILYNGQIFGLIGGGLTVGSGRLYDLGAVHLDEFGVVVD